MSTIFYISGVIAVLATIMVVTRVNAVHALLYLIVSLLAVAMIFFTLGAPFVAALEVIIYAGAIMVLFVFVIMMLNLGAQAAAQERQLFTPSMLIGPAILALLLLGEVIYVAHLASGATIATAATSPKQVGYVLLNYYLVGVELSSILLLAALVGAYHLGRPRSTGNDETQGAGPGFHGGSPEIRKPVG